MFISDETGGHWVGGRLILSVHHLIYFAWEAERGGGREAGGGEGGDGMRFARAFHVNEVACFPPIWPSYVDHILDSKPQIFNPKPSRKLYAAVWSWMAEAAGGHRWRGCGSGLCREGLSLSTSSTRRSSLCLT